MTKKHFEMIAAVISGLEEINDNQRFNIALRFADKLAPLNPSFDRAKFLAACMQ